jgi:two-component system sensor histidine kinase/response regulator
LESKFRNTSSTMFLSPVARVPRGILLSIKMVFAFAAMSSSLHSIAAKAKTILIDNKIPLGTLATGDKNMVELVLRNLLSNAMKFTNDGGKITLIAESRADQLHIGIIDSGIGIPKEDFGRVLGKDYFNTPGTNKERGSGLGLRLCKEFLDHNNGTLWFDPNPDKGTTFWFLLPKA